MAKHRKALVLNADYTAIALTNWKQAIKKDFEGKIKVVDFYEDDKIDCGHGLYWPSPAVVVTTEYKKREKLRIPFSRKYVFIRDRLTCQYCNEVFPHKELTFDHVIPRSRFTGKGSPTTWCNIVTCCKLCNTRKDSYTLKECGMTLIKEPNKPDPRSFILGMSPWDIIQPEWIQYIPKFYLDLLKVSDRKIHV